MNETIANTKRGIQWELTTTLEDLDFADDIVLLSSSHKDMQEKINSLILKANTIGMKINIGKTKLLKQNARNEQPITINGIPVEEVKEFTYLGSTVTEDGDSSRDIDLRITKATQAFGALFKIWKSKKLSMKTKVRIFKSNVLSVLLYGSECWKMTNKTIQKLDSFQTKCLKKIKRVFWLNIIRNEDLLKETQMEMISTVIEERRWRWIGHVMRMPHDSLPRIAAQWTPQGKRGRGRPIKTWRSTATKMLSTRGLTWGTARRKAEDRICGGLFSFMVVLCVMGT